MIKISDSIVSIKWLFENLEASNLVVLNASLGKVIDQGDETALHQQIPSARFFDLKHKFSDTSANFPNTIPSEAQFTQEAQKLGINKDSVIVIYDETGIYSSPRAWWLFKVFGHQNVAVLDGGFVNWNQAKYPVENKQEYSGRIGNFVANYNPKLIKHFRDIKEVVNDEHTRIIDGRSEKRFKSLVSEPRKGLRSGTIPDSVNVPYNNLLDHNVMRPKEVIAVILDEFITVDDPVIFSCGSGITACVLALGADICGFKNIAVYDGSWTEWGSLTKE